MKTVNLISVKKKSYKFNIINNISKNVFL